MAITALLLGSIAATAGVFASPVARPRTNAVTEGSFSVEQVRNVGFAGHHGPLALARAYIKYGLPLPHDLSLVVAGLHLSVGLGKRKTGTVVATPTLYDIEYLCPVSIGTPPQVLQLDFDTGSSDLWVFSSETPSTSVNGQTVYNPSRSSTAKRLDGQTWDIQYGDGSESSGGVYADKVTVGNLTVPDMAVESAQQVSAEFTADSELDGLLGLGFSHINTVRPTQQQTFFDRIKSSLDAPVFTANLKRGQAGKYDFGWIDQAAYTGTLTYTGVDSTNGWWMFTSPGYAVGANTVGSTSITGIADTGTTLLLLSDDVVSDYYRTILSARYDSSQGGYVFPCRTTPPNFTFAVGNSKIVIPGSFINVGPTEQTGTTCFGGIQSNGGLPFSIFGDVALKAAFVVFDGGSPPRLGFASKAI